MTVFTVIVRMIHDNGNDNRIILPSDDINDCNISTLIIGIKIVTITIVHKAATRASRVEDMDTDDAAAAMGRVQQVDLDDLAFHQGSHLMANKRCHLPDGSFRKQKKGGKEKRERERE